MPPSRPARCSSSSPRVGLLAAAFTAYTIVVLRTLPITLDPSRSYFARGLLALADVALLALVAFAISIGRKGVWAGGCWRRG